MDLKRFVEKNDLLKKQESPNTAWRNEVQIMKNTTTLNTTLIIAAIVFATAGCSNKDKFFPEQDTYRSSQKMMDAQVAAAVRDNGNLYDCHFNNAALNSLGRQQLDSAVRGKQGDGPVVVRLQDENDHDLVVRRMESVAAYLKESGLQDNQIVFSDTFNDSTYTPAAVGLSNLAKTDTAEQTNPAPKGQYGTSVDVAK